MGAGQTESLTSRFLPEEWQATSLQTYTALKDPHFGSNFRVLSHMAHPTRQIERYDLVFNCEQEYRSYREVANWRSSCRFLVGVRYLQDLRDHGLCSSFHYAALYLDRTPLRLFEIDDISLEEGLYILYAAAQGLEKLYEKFGFFEVETDLIGFTREGEVRVWLNKNFSRQLPDGIPNRRKGLSDMLSKLLVQVEALIDYQHHPKLSTFQTRHKQLPKNCLSPLLELYSKEQGISVPHFLTSIRNLCKGTPKRRGQERNSQADSNRSCFSRRDSKKNPQLELNNTVFNISINTPSKRSYIDPPDNRFSKKIHSMIMPTPRLGSNPLPSVRFHYSRCYERPESPRAEPLGRKSKTMSTLAPSERSFHKNKLIFGSGSERVEIDPQIAADLQRMAEHSI